MLVLVYCAALALSAWCVKWRRHDVKPRGIVEGIIHEVRIASDGWTLHEATNCYPGRGSGKFPDGWDVSIPELISLSECMSRCEINAICEAIVVDHAQETTVCHHHAWVDPSQCEIGNPLFDLWVLNEEPQPARVGALTARHDRLSSVVEMVKQDSFRSLDLKRCALVGASSVMAGTNAGAEIDGHDAVIRLNRLPTEAFHPDFGTRTDILFVSFEWRGEVALMSGEQANVAWCHEVDHCNTTAIVSRSDVAPCDLPAMVDTWGPTHPLLGCQQKNISRMVATGFASLQGMMPTTGLQAFFTFLPVCDELNLYGFGGRDTADGHTEWNGHNLYEEHIIEDKIAAGQWDDIFFRRAYPEVDFLRAHAAKVRKVIGTNP